MTTSTTYHPSIMRAATRFRQWYAGERDYLVQVHIPVQRDDLVPAPAYDGLDWEQDFDAYVAGNVANAKKFAESRLDLDIYDDTIPAYFPYFGISIHSSFFGGAVSFGGGTSYMEAVIARAADWATLRPDPQNVWLQRLLRGLAYCRDHGDGLLLAAYRGANGPMDMANAVLGNAFFTEIYDDPENTHRVLEICTRGIQLTFDMQRQQISEIAGGHVNGSGMPPPSPARRSTRNSKSRTWSASPRRAVASSCMYTSWAGMSIGISAPPAA